MSQPKDFGPNESDPLGQPLVAFDQMVKLFHDAERSEKDFLIGIEYEMFGQTDDGMKPLPYEGDISITSLFSRLADMSKNHPDPFIPVLEDDHLVALNSDRAVIALEPGGQLEIALKPHHHLSNVVDNFSLVIEEIKKSASDLGIELFALGIHPSARKDDMARVKKARYTIMRNYMEGLSGLGLDMMTRSCSIQLNLDFLSEQDMVSKTRLSATLVPFYSLLCSSVAFVERKRVTHAIERGHIWRLTDPDRTGIPSIIFDKDFGYASWINMVLSVPMYFIRREKTYHNVAGASFRQFMTHGLMGHRASLRDFVDHMSTVFTEVRLKPILELRSADSLPAPFAYALTALTWALFYCDKAHRRACEIFSEASHQEIVSLHNDAIDHGRGAQFRGMDVFSITKNLLIIAQDELDNTHNPKLASLLNPFWTLMEKNITCAEWIAESFPLLDDAHLKSLIKNFDPHHNPLA